MALPTIGALWMSNPLSFLEQLCLKSFVDAGHEVVLFHYDDIPNVPDGVQMADAAEILPKDGFLVHERTGSPALHSDVFRYRMLRAHKGMIWADTDAYCVKPFETRTGHFFGWESETQINGGVLGLPTDSEALAGLLDFTTDEFAIPEWASGGYLDKLIEAREAGTPMHVSEQPWGVWGPHAVTHFLKKTGEAKYALPQEGLYPVPYGQRRVMLRPDFDTSRYITPGTYSIHFYGRRMRSRILSVDDGIPQPTSLIGKLLTKHGIDPHAAPIARRRPKPAAKAQGDTDAILAALDLDDVGSFADVNGSAPDLAIALSHRFGSKVTYVPMKPNGQIFAKTDDRFQQYKAKLATAGVAVAQAKDGKKLGQFDVIATLDGFGSAHNIAHFQPFLDRALHQSSRLVLDVRKGSGSYPFLKRYGNCNTMWPATNTTPARVVMSVEPQVSAAGEWSDIATGLAGPGGFFTDCGEHSFLYVPRGDTLVVTFDNLDIAMTKRTDRRPWGYGFIEAKGWSMLGVMANGWTWFRDPAVLAEFDRLRDAGFFAKFARVVFYGASMGGYAAAAFSAAAPGATVLAISPQSTLNKEIVPWETRYKSAWDRDFNGPYGDAAKASSAAAQVHIVFDPYVALDRGHAERFDNTNVHEWRCPMMGHRVGTSLQNMGILQPIVQAAIEGELTPLAFQKLLRQRHTSPRYQRELANLALDRGRPHLAERVCRFVLARREDAYFSKMLNRIAEPQTA